MVLNLLSFSISFLLEKYGSSRFAGVDKNGKFTYKGDPEGGRKHGLAHNYTDKFEALRVANRRAKLEGYKDLEVLKDDRGRFSIFGKSAPEPTPEQKKAFLISVPIVLQYLH